MMPLTLIVFMALPPTHEKALPPLVAEAAITVNQETDKIEITDTERALLELQSEALLSSWRKEIQELPQMQVEHLPSKWKDEIRELKKKHLWKLGEDTVLGMQPGHMLPVWEEEICELSLMELTGNGINDFFAKLLHGFSCEAKKSTGVLWVIVLIATSIASIFLFAIIFNLLAQRLKPKFRVAAIFYRSPKSQRTQNWRKEQ